MTPRLRRILFWLSVFVAGFFFVAGVWNLRNVIRQSQRSQQLAERGLRGEAQLISKDAARVHRRGDWHYAVKYQVMTPPLPNPQYDALRVSDWHSLQINDTLVYLYHANEPTAGLLELQRPVLEGWLGHRFGLVFATTGSFVYLAWLGLRRLRKQAGTRASSGTA